MCTTRMVAAVRKNPNPKSLSHGGAGRERTTRPPLTPSEPENSIAPQPRRSKPRDVTSRYLSSYPSPSPSLSASSNPRRCPSPIVSRTPAPGKMAPTPSPAAKRSQSAERRRPVMTPNSSASDSRNWSGGGEISAAQKMICTSTRSLSVSFQGGSFSFQVSKAKPAPRSTPERRKTPIRSLSFDEERRSGNYGSGANVGRGLSSHAGEVVNSPVTGSESTSEDSESVSSGGSIGRRGSRGFVVPARFREEPISVAAVRAFATGSNLIVPLKKLSMDCSVSSSRGVVSVRRQASPARGAFRPASPARAVIMTPSRGISPSRAMSGGNNTPSILNFAADLRRGKVAENRIVDAHVLRLLYNRLMQWRFVNARADIALSAQKLNAEESLYSAWIKTGKLRESVKAKRAELQFMRQTLKLISILKGQMVYLDEWSLVDQAYTGALSGAIESLRASTLRLPVIGGARAEIQDIKDAICSAVDVLQAMVSSISLLSPRVEQVKSSVGELSTLTAKERASLSHCKILLSTVAALQVKESSIKTQVVQLTRKQT